MTVTTIDTDTEALTLTLVADFAVPLDAVWELWADPRKLERWWGPPSYPATFVEHDLTPGALVTYFMTSPEGDKHYGWWRIRTVDAPRGLTIEDGFGDADGTPLTDKTGLLRMRLSEHDGGTRMELHDQFPSLEQMEEMLKMGMEEGLRQAVGQMDGLLSSVDPLALTNPNAEKSSR